MRRGFSSPVALACLAAVQVVRPDAAAGQGLDLRVRQGYDTNVFQIPTTADARRVEAHYSQLLLAYEVEPGDRGLSFFARPAAELKWYPESSGANEYGTELAVGLRNAWRNPKPRADWLREAVTNLEVTAGYERALFIRRQTREELQQGTEVSTTSISVTQLPSRFRFEGELSVESELTGDLTVEGGALAEYSDYTDGGATVTRSFDRLDGRDLGLFAAAELEVISDWTVGAGARWRDRAYPKRSARDAFGQDVPNETRHYWQWDLTGSLEWKTGRVRNEVEAEYTRRDDRQAGYYSYDAWSLGDRLRLRPAGRVNVELRYAYGRKAYDVYNSTRDPSAPPTQNRYHDARALVSVDVTPGLRIALGSDYERTRSNDPLYDFERLGAFAEVRLSR